MQMYKVANKLRHSKVHSLVAFQCPKIAMPGIPAKPMSIDWRAIIFNVLTIKGIYAREMYETGTK